jgi:L-lysine 2,3-aminomutase
MISDTKELLRLLNLNSVSSCEDVFDDCSAFPLQVSEDFVSRIKPNDSSDPLLLQILPRVNELQEVDDFVTDPLSEQKYSPISGLVHKYEDRVLLQITDICAINCRFCFRRHTHNKISSWQEVLKYINEHASIHEVILSGGDPLMLDHEELIEIIRQLAEISHLERLRIHTRVPIALPKLTLPKLTQTRLPIILVIQCNHPNEIDENVAMTIKLLRQMGIVIFNQAVLLRNINDSVDVLINLSKKLFAIGVLPYYLHMLDKVKGAAHFYVENDVATQIYAELKMKLPGYLVPKLVIEIEGKKLYV